MKYDFECKELVGAEPCGFKSSGWDTKKLRDKRAKQHLEEHETGEPMQELADFRSENGVKV